MHKRLNQSRCCLGWRKRVLQRAPGEYDWTICLWRRCGLMSHYFRHFLTSFKHTRYYIYIQHVLCLCGIMLNIFNYWLTFNFVVFCNKIVARTVGRCDLQWGFLCLLLSLSWSCLCNDIDVCIMLYNRLCVCFVGQHAGYALLLITEIGRGWWVDCLQNVINYKFEKTHLNILYIFKLMRVNNHHVYNMTTVAVARLHQCGLRNSAN